MYSLKLEDSIIGYKVAFIVFKIPGSTTRYDTKPVIIKLKIPKGAYATHGFFNPFTAVNTSYPYRKRRCSIAIVEEIWSVDMKYKYKKAIGHSYWDSDFVYSIGSVVEPKRDFCFNEAEICAPGIHFFDTIVEARHYLNDNYIGCGHLQPTLNYLYKKDKQLRKDRYK